MRTFLGLPEAPKGAKSAWIHKIKVTLHCRSMTSVNSLQKPSVYKAIRREEPYTRIL